MITTQEVPENRSINSDEIAPYIFRVKAIATDGRAIEATGSDEDDLLKSVIASVHQFEDKRKAGLGDAMSKVHDLPEMFLIVREIARQIRTTGDEQIT